MLLGREDDVFVCWMEEMVSVLDLRQLRHKPS